MSAQRRPSNHARDGWMGPDVVMDPDPVIEPPFICHMVRTAGPDSWRCVDCGQTFDTWPSDTERCPGKVTEHG